MINNHWLSFANRVPSRNFNNRSSDNISLIVVHSISLPPGIYGNHFIEDFFTNKLDISQDPYFDEISGLEVSAHLLINVLEMLFSLYPLIKELGMLVSRVIKVSQIVITFQ